MKLISEVTVYVVFSPGVLSEHTLRWRGRTGLFGAMQHLKCLSFF